MKIKRLLCAVLSVTVLLRLTVLAAFNADENTVARITAHPISPGLDYTSTIEVCNGIRQEIHTFTYEPGSATRIVPAYGQYIYGFNSVGGLISSYKGEGRVVGGINTDFFITSTGIPLSCFVSDGEIISSCDNRAALGIDKNGNAVVGYPKIGASLISEQTELDIAHINKTPAIWGAYLVTDTFASTTKTSTESIEIVLKSYNAETTDRAIEEYLEQQAEKKNTSEGAVDDEDDAVGDNSTSTEEDDGYYVSENASDNENDDKKIVESEIHDIDDESENNEGEESKIEVSELSDAADETILDEKKDETDIETDGENGSKALGEDVSDIEGAKDDNLGSEFEEEPESSDTESDSEDTSSEDNSDTENQETAVQEKERIPIELFDFSSERMPINGAVDVVITEIRDGVKNGVIPENSYVLCIPKEQFGYLASGMAVGDRFSLVTECDEKFRECVSIFGAGSIILEDGKFVKQAEDSIYIYRNPRTAAGVREDGTIVFVCVDGRRAGESNGFTITELADYMKSLGCVSVVNFDGGGSTTFYAADIGETGANRKNIPSDGSERRVANGMLFVNLSEPTEQRMNASLYPNHFLVFNKGVAAEIFGKVGFSDMNGYPMPLGENESVTLSVDERFGFTYNGIFVPNGRAGRAEIIAHIPESDERYYAGFIEITDTVDEINLEAASAFLTPFDGSTQLSLNVLKNTLPVDFTPYSVDWSIEAETELQDGEKSFRKVGEDEAYLYISGSTVHFIPVLRDVDYKITASMGDRSETIEIFAEGHPFSDMELHWASRTSYEMYKDGLILGEVSWDGVRSFMPSRNMTRAEFCTVLARLLGLDTSYYPKPVTNDTEEMSEYYEELALDSTEESLEDTADTYDELMENETINLEEAIEHTSTSEPYYENEYAEDDKNAEIIMLLSDVPEWARGSVYALYTKGCINDLVYTTPDGNNSLGAADYITRNDVIRVLGSLLDGEGDLNALEKYPDFVPTKKEDELYFARMIGSGIISGYEDGTVRGEGNLTRAEAATVFSRFIAYNE